MATTEAAGGPPATHRDRTHFLYLAVVVAVILGVVVGLVFGEGATELEPIGDAFIALISR